MTMYGLIDISSSITILSYSCGIGNANVLGLERNAREKPSRQVSSYKCIHISAVNN